MAKKKATKKDLIVCKTIRVNAVQIVDQQGRHRAVIDTSGELGLPCISFFDPYDPSSPHITINLSRDGHASIGIGGKTGITVGLSSLGHGQKAVFVHDDNGQEVFSAGIDINGERFIRLVASDGSTIWEKRK